MLVQLHLDFSRNWFKGADTAVLCRFLQAHYARVLADYDGDSEAELATVHAALCAANDFLSTLFRSNLWMTKGQANHAAHRGFAFLSAYAKCAAWALSLELPRFKLQPKYHMMAHICHQLLKDSLNPHAEAVQNPLSASCQMDEDFVGKMSLIARKEHPRSLA